MPPAASEPIGDDELAGWLRLTEAPGVGPATCRALLGAFGLPDAIFSASREQLVRIVSPAAAAALRAAPTDALSERIRRTVDWVREPGNHLVTLADARYPARLLETTDPPPLLYVKGDVALLGRDTLAIVGSRNATTQGTIDARRFAEALAAVGHTIVSGLALGIDAAAHEGALAAGPTGGRTVAVVGTGADLVYPSAHRSLAHRIAATGAIVSELPLGTPAAAHHFPRRNRIIAGLARGVLVVEAAARSGSLITARLAVECGRDVLAVPGSIHSPLSKGCHQLIRQGAKLVDSVADIVEELGGSIAVKATATDRREASRPGDGSDGMPSDATREPVDRFADDPLGRLLGFDPVSLDELAERSGLPPQRLAAVMLDLELSGRVARLPGGRVQRLVA